MGLCHAGSPLELSLSEEALSGANKVSCRRRSTEPLCYDSPLSLSPSLFSLLASSVNMFL
jgi:hypothetical protein